jgi:hypothetical protein
LKKPTPHIGFLTLIGLILLAPKVVIAQFTQLPTPKKPQEKKSEHFRIQENPLKIPFWDDFSITGLDTTKWIVRGATQSFTVGNEAPSYGVVLLDGTNENGKPYSTTQLDQGETDQITSKPIDLSAITSVEENSVYLSFFWQAGGKAEMPDAADEIRLDFLDANGIWVTVWEKAGGLSAEQLFFTQELIQIRPIFQHVAFQFRFSIRGRSSGPFDSWILDYILLDKNRNANDLFTQDRALTLPNGRPFERYSAVPLFMIKRDSEAFWTNTQNEFKNLSNTFRAMEYSFEIRDKESQSVVKSVNSNTPFNPVPTAQERRGFSSNPIEDIALADEEKDYELVSYLVTGDGLLQGIENGQPVTYPSVDFRDNDTVRTLLPIRDFLAYDDGKVDYSAGINQRSGTLALRYEVDGPAFLKGISINFTNFAQVNSVVDINVWRDLEQTPIYSREVIIPDKGALENFAYFEIDRNVEVGGVFFVGFTQFTNDFVHVGLDKTYDNGQEIFFNVSGAWQQNERIQGSLMIRPHLSASRVIQTDADASISVRAYPNPVSGPLNLEGDFDSFEVFDPVGRRINLPVTETEEGKIINFESMQMGVYVIKASKGKHLHTFRILVK